MKIIDFNTGTVSAFGHGFMKGLGAPMMVLSDFSLPPVDIPPMIDPDQKSIEQVLANDWANIGADFQSAVKSYAKEIEKSE